LFPKQNESFAHLFSVGKLCRTACHQDGAPQHFVLLVRAGLEKIFLVGGLGVEDQQNGFIEVALSLHFMSFRALGLKRKQNK
jgi:hypothetical protein